MADRMAASASWRSLLFVPGDRPDRFAKAAASGADAIILDLEDSVAASHKNEARQAVASFLTSFPASAPAVSTLVRVNALQSADAAADAAMLRALPALPAALVLPKAEGADSVVALQALIGRAAPPVLPIATETPAAIFALGGYAAVGERLAGLSWGAEDLPAAIGASSAREADGRYTPPYELARSLTLFAAHAAGVAAIETVFPALGDADGLAAYVARARRDGFSAMLAIHPAQIATINAGFTPGDEELTRARAIVAAFAANPGVGALRLDGAMIDHPHLVQARRLLARAHR